MSEKLPLQPYLKEFLAELPDSPRYWVAYSGGVDSHVLLHTFYLNKQHITAELNAIHVNHGISQYADSWQLHCQKICENYQIKYASFKIQQETPKKNIENWARQQRYTIFSDLMGQNDILFTAHHINDQAETFLLRLMRGSGCDGLSAIKKIKTYKTGWLIRPLLNYTKAEILAFAKKQSLKWIEDESNQDNKLDRNLIRQEIIPKLENRWPSAVKLISKASNHQSDAAEFIYEISQQDIKEITTTRSNIISINSLKKFSYVRQKNALRLWLKNEKIPAPNTDIINNIIKEIIHARHDSNPCLNWKGRQIRRYRENIYALSPFPPHDPSMQITWNIKKPITLPTGILTATKTNSGGIKMEAIKDHCLNIKFRQGGERMVLKGTSHRQQLKKMFQKKGIPPWYRYRIPLLYSEEKLIAVADMWIDTAFSENSAYPAWKITFKSNLEYI